MDSFFKKSFQSIIGGSSNRSGKTRYLSLNDGLKLSTKILIEGKVLPAASKYEISLWCGFVVSDDLLRNGNIAMHLVINPPSGQAILNSRSGRSWASEERTTRGMLPPPLLQNQEFKLCIEVQPSQYQVNVNEKDFLKFIHRHPFETVGLLSYEGDFEVTRVEIVPYVAPSLSSMIPLCPNPSANNDHIICDVKLPHLPLLLPIKPGLCPGMFITIDGRISGNRFDISLYQGSNPYGDPRASVAFHMEIYMDSRSIVRNSNENNEWKEAETDITHFPFFGQSAFNLVIRVEGNRYQVMVGGHYIFDFKHRINLLSSIDHLCLHGSVDISSITVSVPPL